MQSVPITTNVMNLNSAHGELCMIQLYVIKFVSELRQVWISLGTSVSPTNKTDITEILLQVALNTITTPVIHRLYSTMPYWDHIYQFNPATCLCLSQARTWISNVICHGSVCVQRVNVSIYRWRSSYQKRRIGSH
jgi:predicted metal-binding membrane protein